MTYTNGEQMTIVVESMVGREKCALMITVRLQSYQKSICEYSSPRPYSVKLEQKIQFKIPFSKFKNLKKFKALKGLNISLNFQTSQFVPLKYGKYLEFTLPIDSFGVITTLPISVPSEITVFPSALPYKYFDDFSDYENGEEPRFWMPQKGSWEVRNGRAVQKVVRPPISWCTSHIRSPYAVMA